MIPASESVPLCELSGREVRHLLRRMCVPQLVAPFRAHQVDGRLLGHVQCVQDLIDIDLDMDLHPEQANRVKPIFARRLFAELTQWNGMVPREMLLPMPGKVRLFHV